MLEKIPRSQPSSQPSRPARLRHASAVTPPYDSPMRGNQAAVDMCKWSALVVPAGATGGIHNEQSPVAKARAECAAGILTGRLRRLQLHCDSGLDSAHMCFSLPLLFSSLIIVCVGWVGVPMCLAWGLLSIFWKIDNRFIFKAT